MSLAVARELHRRPSRLGQDCTAAARVIATRGVHDALLEELVPAAASLRVGDPAEGDEIESGAQTTGGFSKRTVTRV